MFMLSLFLLFLVFSQTCKGINDAIILHTLDLCYTPYGLNREFKFTADADSVIIETFKPPSNCSASTLVETEKTPFNQCVPDKDRPSQIYYWSRPGKNYTVPYTGGAFMWTSYEDCPAKGETLPSFGQRY